MAWTVEFLPVAERELRKIDRPVRERLLLFLRERIRGTEDPRRHGEPLRGPELGKYWKYRVGDYRIICSIQDQRLVVLVVGIGHRREVYR
jgi:mRNA interferase RelE/StbE